MFDLIKKAIVKKDRKDPTPYEENDSRTKTAACVVLLEAAFADEECSEDELAHVLETIKHVFSISSELAEELVELGHQERRRAIDIWQFTNQINQEFTHQEKIRVMDAVWRVIYADGNMDMHEDYFAHKLANLLRLSHSEMINAKLKAKEGLPE